LNNLVCHITRLKYYALSLTNDVQDSKDLLQDLAVKVFSNLSYWENKTDEQLRCLLTLTIKRLHIDWWRKEQRAVKIAYNTVENDAWGRIEKMELQKALLNLSETQRLCFRLRLDGYPTKEISSVLSLKTNNVNQYLMKAKVKLRKQLAA